MSFTFVKIDCVSGLLLQRIGVQEEATPTIKVTKYANRSLQMALLQVLIRPFGSLISVPGKDLAEDSPRLNAPSSILRACNVNERCIDGIYIYDVTAKVPFTDSNLPENGPSRVPRFYYIAGGSFAMRPSSEHWAFIRQLITKIPNSVVSLISPPLAPRNPAPTTFPRLVKLYKSLVANSDGEAISFIGDSSGGNLVCSLVLQTLKNDSSLKSPDNIMLIAPVVDLALSNPAVKEIESKDPMLRRETEVKAGISWAGSWGLADPRCSPLLADLNVFRDRGIKVHGVTGGYDILTPDTILFRDKCQMLGVAGEWLEWDKQIHCFPMAFSYGLQEAIQGKDWIIDVLKRNT